MIAAAPEAGGPRREIMWLKDHLSVRHTISSSGFHTFATAEVAELLAEALSFPEAAAAQAGPQRTLTEDELDELLAGARRIVTVEATRRVGDDRFIVAEPVGAGGARERAAALVASIE